MFRVLIRWQFWVLINESSHTPGLSAPSAAPQFQFSPQIWKCLLSEESPGMIGGNKREMQILVLPGLQEI
jgi:hypothetical protein